MPEPHSLTSKAQLIDKILKYFKESLLTTQEAVEIVGINLYFQMTNKLRFLSALAGLSIVAATGIEGANSVSYRGITWTFSSDRPTGTFANGEPWVLGPVTITNITPNPSQSTVGVQNGSMINPTPETNFGFDSSPAIYGLQYDAAKNVALSFPFSLNAGDALVSSRSSGVYPNWLKTVCVLTVLNTAAQTGDFRPSIFGTNRSSRWNVSQIDWNVLKNYAVTPSTPKRADIELNMPPLPWFEWSHRWDGERLQPSENTADNNRVYGREIAGKFGFVGMWLNTNQPIADKKEIAIRMIQNGIDIYDYLRLGGGFLCDGGHKCGRKLPLVMAAMMLKDPNLLAMAGNPTLFQEDQQVWFVNQADVGRAIWMPLPGDSWYGREFLTYRQEDVGMAEWGIRHSRKPDEDNRSWSATYRDVVGNGMMGPWLTAYLMGAQTTWNYPAAFAYMERWKGLSGYGGATYGQSLFNKEMWETHKRNVVVQPPTTPPPAAPQGLRIVE